MLYTNRFANFAKKEKKNKTLRNIGIGAAGLGGLAVANRYANAAIAGAQYLGKGKRLEGAKFGARMAFRRDKELAKDIYDRAKSSLSALGSKLGENAKNAGAFLGKHKGKVLGGAALAALGGGIYMNRKGKKRKGRRRR